MALFAATLFVSAFLLFLVQPMVARMILPLLGGTPAVWNSCMVFFQAALLGGYLYAHALPALLGIRRHAPLHVAAMLLALPLLPVAVSSDSVSSLDWQGEPFVWVVVTLTAAVGLPFFFLATTAPLLQLWFSRTRASGASDPYFLYAASNAGSLAALLAYPVVFEPALRLGDQSRAWAWGYGLLVILVGGAALSALRAPRPADAAPSGSPEPLKLVSRARWVLLSFVPSSLTLGVTTYLTTDIAPVPLLWVVPLSFYLLTFIIAFARTPVPVSLLSRYALPALALCALFLHTTPISRSLWLVAVHLALLFVAALVCHTRLAVERPSPSRLTEFYLWVSFGGVLGGLFNALAAPNLFNSVAEYPLVILLACLMRPRVGPAGGRRERLLDFVFPAALAAAVMLAARTLPLGGAFLALVSGMAVAYLAVERPLRFALAAAAVTVAGSFIVSPEGATLHRGRNFFGVVRVTRDPESTVHRLYHGRTLHNEQYLDPGRRCQPLGYYFPTSPVARVFEVYNLRPDPPRVAGIGLGAGGTAVYSRPGQQWTYYEIDPDVIGVAKDPRYFTFLSECAGAEVSTVLGDARLRIGEAPDRAYGLIVLDAFSSDAIPVHLLTREAIELYLSKLSEDGVLVFHVTNAYLDLPPILGGAAASLGLPAIVSADTTSDEEARQGKRGTAWVVMARGRNRLDEIAANGKWRPLGPGGKAVWTDDFSNILSALR